MTEDPWALRDYIKGLRIDVSLTKQKKSEITRRANKQAHKRAKSEIEEIRREVRGLRHSLEDMLIKPKTPDILKYRTKQEHLNTAHLGARERIQDFNIKYSVEDIVNECIHEMMKRTVEDAFHLGYLAHELGEKHGPRNS